MRQLVFGIRFSLLCLARFLITKQIHETDIGFATLLAAQLLLGGCGSTPSLRVNVADGTAVADVQTFGEYPTIVTRARLVEKQDGSTIWEIGTKDGTPQIHKLVFISGVNPANLPSPDGGTYTINTPTEQGSFVLRQDVTYTLEIWGSSTNGEPVKADFTFRH